MYVKETGTATLLFDLRSLSQKRNGHSGALRGTGSPRNVKPAGKLLNRGDERSFLCADFKNLYFFFFVISRL